MDAEFANAGPILYGLRELCRERAEVTSKHLTTGEMEQLDRILAEYDDSKRNPYGPVIGEEWRSSLSHCLFG